MELDLTHDLFMAWRFVNVVLGIVCLVWLYMVTRRLKGGFSNAGRTFVNAHLWLVLAAVWAAAESVVQDHSVGARSVLVTVGLLCTIVSLIRYKELGEDPGDVER